MKLFQVTVFKSYYSSLTLLVDHRGLIDLIDILEQSEHVEKYFVRDLEDGEEVTAKSSGTEDCNKWSEHGVAKVEINGSQRQLRPVLDKEELIERHKQTLRPNYCSREYCELEMGECNNSCKYYISHKLKFEKRLKSIQEETW